MTMPPQLQHTRGQAGAQVLTRSLQDVRRRQQLPWRGGVTRAPACRRLRGTQELQLHVVGPLDSRAQAVPRG
jgi:hypothetical protein